MRRMIMAIRSRKVSILIFVAGFFMGMVAGIFLSPVKEGIKICCNNGNNYNKKESDDFSEDLAMEMGELR